MRFDADMDKVKLALTVLSIAIVVVPVLDVVFITETTFPPKFFLQSSTNNAAGVPTQTEHCVLTLLSVRLI